MERNLIVITFQADFISSLGHDLSEDGICYLLMCVDCVGVWAPTHPLRPAPHHHHPVPYGHKLVQLVIIVGLRNTHNWKKLCLGAPI